MKLLKQLVEREVAKVLDEARSTPGNPNVFWLVTSVGPKDEKAMNSLLSGELEGVKGISDNNRILMHWLGMGRNSVLVMKASEVRQENPNISKIWYDNPKQLTDNNLALLRRIFNADEAPRGNGRILSNLWRRAYQNLLQNGDKILSRLGGLMRDGYIPTYDVFADYEEGKTTIDSPEDLAAFFKRGVDEIASQKDSEVWQAILGIDKSTWESIVKQAITDSVHTYSSEGEWVVTDSSFKVPEGSKLLVAVHTTLDQFPEEAQEMLKRGQEPKLGIEIPPEVWTRNMSLSLNTILSVYQTGLSEKYDVRFIDLNKFKKIQLKLQVKHQYG